MASLDRAGDRMNDGSEMWGDGMGSFRNVADTKGLWRICRHLPLRVCSACTLAILKKKRNTGQFRMLTEYMIVI